MYCSGFAKLQTWLIYAHKLRFAKLARAEMYKAALSWCDWNYQRWKPTETL